MSQNMIKIRGARVNNLKSIDVDIPLNKITALGGPSGSGKSSLAFHCLYTESKRRFLNSFPNYLKFFGDRPAKADVDLIEPVLPVFALPQVNPLSGQRTTVSDSLGLGDLLSHFWYLNHVQVCPKHQEVLKVQFPLDILEKAIESQSDKEAIYFFLRKEGFLNLISTGMLPSRSFSLTEKIIRPFQAKDEFYEVFRLRKQSIKESFSQRLDELNLPQDKGELYFWHEGLEEPLPLQITSLKQCPECDYIQEGQMQLSNFSPYNALGACEYCRGYGANLVYSRNKIVKNPNLSLAEGALVLLTHKRFSAFEGSFKRACSRHNFDYYIPFSEHDDSIWELIFEGEGDWPGLNVFFQYLEERRYKPHVRIYIRSLQEEVDCDQCLNTRLRESVRLSKIGNSSYSYEDLVNTSLVESYFIFSDILNNFEFKNPITEDLRERITLIYEHGISLGLSELLLSRKSKTLSAGEYQRCLLLKFLGHKGSDSLFILDEPSLGLDIDQQESLLKGLQTLRDQGNTILLVEHSPFLLENSDFYLELGPAAGNDGGTITSRGKFSPSSVTLNKVSVSGKKKEWMIFKDVESLGMPARNFKILKDGINLVTGPSGSGKSTYLVNGIGNFLARELSLESLSPLKGNVSGSSGLGSLSDIALFNFDIGKSNRRSTVGSITGLNSMLKSHFKNLSYSKSLKLKEGHFSPNSELGRCEDCEGRGEKIIEMQFLEDIVLACESCNGLGLKKEIAEISDGKITVAEAYTRPLKEVLQHISLTPKFKRVWDKLELLSLDYLSMKRTLPSLSGGERQRLKLVSKLSKTVRDSFFIFENPTFGIGPREINQIFDLFSDLVDSGNTVVVLDTFQGLERLAHHQIDISH